jgi:hypothetical protein
MQAHEGVEAQLHTLSPVPQIEASSFTDPAALLPGKGAPILTEGEVGWAPGPVWGF